MEEQKTLYQLVEELKEAVIIAWNEIVKIVREVVNSIREFFITLGIIPRRITIMKKKINRYMEYKRLALWLILTKDKE